MNSCTTGSKHVFHLQPGTLEVEVSNSDHNIPLDKVCHGGSRKNPKRPFLFVLDNIAKHKATKPSDKRDLDYRLASKIDADLPGPLLFIGMAETAVCLGHGIHDEYVKRTGRDDVLYLHSTRYRLKNRPLACDFLEEHSHASDQFLYEPESPTDRALLSQVRSVVLLDDEASTGKTFKNLAVALKQRYSTIENVVTAVITDWRDEEMRESNRLLIPANYTSVALLEGRYDFTPRPSFQLEPAVPSAVGNSAEKNYLLTRDGRLSNYGRLGVRNTSNSVKQLVEKLADGLKVRAGQKILVLGTGEFSWPPFLLAEELELRGTEVYCQSTTRSPVRVDGAIERAFSFSDNYGDGIPNFIYNASPADYDRVIIGSETPTATIDPRLIAHFNAELVQF